MDKTRENVFGYVRCSTEEQGHSGLGVAAQWDAIFNYCRLKGWETVQRFEDLGESGDTPLASRTHGQVLAKQMQAGACLLVVAKLDRLFRNSADGCAVIGEWYQKGITLVSIAEGIDLTTPYGRFFARLIVLFAELERELISARTREALAVKRGRGERISREPPYGFRFASSSAGKDGTLGRTRLLPDDKEWDAIELMRQLRRAKLSFRDIAAELLARGFAPRRGSTWSHTTIRKILGMQRHAPRPEATNAPGPDDARGGAELPAGGTG